MLIDVQLGCKKFFNRFKWPLMNLRLWMCRWLIQDHEWREISIRSLERNDRGAYGLWTGMGFFGSNTERWDGCAVSENTLVTFRSGTTGSRISGSLMDLCSFIRSTIFFLLKEKDAFRCDRAFQKEPTQTTRFSNLLGKMTLVGICLSIGRLCSIMLWHIFTIRHRFDRHHNSEK